MAVVDGPAAGAECGANQYTCPAYSAKKCFIGAAAAGVSSVYCQQSQAGQANEQSTSLRFL